MSEKISQKQLEANRQNAKLGGVKTEEGKAVVKYNALKHGLLSQEVIIQGEDKNRLCELADGLRETLEPKGEVESILVDRIISNTWRLKRCLKIEKNLMEFDKNDDVMKISLITSEGQKERENILNMISSHLVERILRYETAIERGIFKSLHELQRLQAIRKGEKVDVPVAIDVNVSQKE